MTIPLIIDIVLLLVIAFFIVSGVRQGFVRTLCSLLAVFVAFFGALFLARSLAQPVANMLTPHALPAIVERLEGDSSDGGSRDFSGQDTGSLLGNLGLPGAWTRMIEEAYEQSDTEPQAFTSPSQILAGFILEIIVYGCIFVLSFLLLLVLWRFISGSLDLIAKLPVLNFCNKTLGGVLGAVKGLIVLLVIRWVLCDLTGQISPELVESTLLFQWVSTLLSGTWLAGLLL